jgi:hypothetical protein
MATEAGLAALERRLERATADIVDERGYYEKWFSCRAPSEVISGFHRELASVARILGRSTEAMRIDALVNEALGLLAAASAAPDTDADADAEGDAAAAAVAVAVAGPSPEVIAQRSRAFEQALRAVSPGVGVPSGDAPGAGEAAARPPDSG